MSLSFREGLHFHNWEIVQERKYLDYKHEEMGLTLKDRIRVCKKCGKTEKLDIHCLGLNPPEYVESWHEIKKDSWRKEGMNKHSNKLNITESKLFLEVSSVIGKVVALEELTKAYREYVPTSDYPFFNWQEELIEAFEWERTPQGDAHWDEIYQEVRVLQLREQGHLV